MSRYPRTRIDCAHPGTPHRHGTTTAYRWDRCRCVACAGAELASRDSRRVRADNDPFRQVSAAPVIEHLHAINAQPDQARQIAAECDVPVAAVRRLIHEQQSVIRYGQACRLLAYRSEQTSEATLMLRALARLGWSARQVAERLGWPVETVAALTTFGNLPVTDNALWNLTIVYTTMIEDDPCADGRSRAAAMRRAHFAKQRGWSYPEDWEDRGMVMTMQARRTTVA